VSNFASGQFGGLHFGVLLPSPFHSFVESFIFPSKEGKMLKLQLKVRQSTVDGKIARSTLLIEDDKE
jgi:hypothetical protein